MFFAAPVRRVVARIAQNAAKARWGGAIHFAPYPGVIEIGDISIPCAVLVDETRILSQVAVLRALGRNPEKSLRAHGEEAEVRPPFLAANNLQEFITDELRELLVPIRYRVAMDKQNNPSWCYRAALLPTICGVYMQAWRAGKLHKNQEDIAKFAGVLLEGLALVGIEALVDEATGIRTSAGATLSPSSLRLTSTRPCNPGFRPSPQTFTKRYSACVNSAGQKEARSARGTSVPSRTTSCTRGWPQASSKN